ncbi:MAG: class I SAM-dependent methyltransferase [Lachnospiraceae bacterium]|nr:class I SAM-dependent methyltransferase [Lachnospiraceae bacterium]
MLEKMGDFFDNRLEGYEEHQLTCIEGAQEFYPFTADSLPLGEDVNILDLGCGTGLELDYYFKLNPRAKVTGIDLAPGMLAALKEKFSDKDITLIQGSYFDIPFSQNDYDAAVSVESLHHFTREQKRNLYRKLYRALKEDGFFILTDYFALSEEEEIFYRQELLRLKKQQGIADDEFYHYDTPLTVEHEIQALKEAGFLSVEILGRWENTYTLRVKKQKSKKE